MATHRYLLHISNLSRWRYFSTQRTLCDNLRTIGGENERKEPNHKQFLEKDELPKISIAAKMLIESNRKNKLKSVIDITDENDKNRNSPNKMFRMKGRLQHMTDQAGKTVSSIQDIMSRQASHLTTTLGCENAVEQVALKQDFEKFKKHSPLHGTEDPTATPSEIPCTGCGALLQCTNQIHPGFMVSEIFKVLNKRELKRSICQRCHYMRHGAAFKEVTVDPEVYAEMISQIRPTRSIVVMVVDLTDINGSILKNLTKYIGVRKPVVVVGNKADLLAPDNPDYLKKVNHHLKAACKSAGLRNVKEYRLVSAKTGFGIEKLITTLFSFYHLQVDVYIVGTANSGKSSLFNMLLGSDYCKNTARNLIQRATVSEWPGTTLNLLKFPITRESHEQQNARVRRLRQEEALKKEAERLALERQFDKAESDTWQLSGTVGLSDTRKASEIQADEDAKPWGQEVVSFQGRKDGGFSALSQSDSRLQMNEFKPEFFSASYWVYDTPGIINPDQLVNSLSPDDCTLITPTSMIIPRCLIVNAQDTVFISGLGRIDIIESEVQVILTVHTSSLLPIRVCPLDQADDYYNQSVGTEELMAPSGDADDLSKLPALEGQEFVVTGEWRGENEVASDLQLSSLGFVSLSLRRDFKVRLKAWTPGGKGLGLQSPLAPNYHAFKASRIGGTPFYKTKPQGSALIGKDTRKLEEYEFTYPVA